MSSEELYTGERFIAVSLRRIFKGKGLLYNAQHAWCEYFIYVIMRFYEVNMCEAHISSNAINLQIGIIHTKRSEIMSEIITIIKGGFERLLGGGWLLIPLAIYSLLAHAVILNRAIALRKKNLLPTFVISEIYKALIHGGPEMAIELCNQSPGVVTNVMKAGIMHRHYAEERLKLVVKFALEDEKPEITKYLYILGMLPSVATTTGLLGTVLGMMKSFGSLYISPKIVAAGIAEALITTVAGLTIAVPAYIAYTYFSNRINNIFTEIERHSISLVRFLATGEYKLFQEEETLDYSDLETIRKEKG